LLTVAAVGAMLVFRASAQTASESQIPSTGTPGSESPASAQTRSESQTPSTGTPGSESQSPSTGTPGSESQSPSTGTPSVETQPQSQDAPTSSTPAKPEAPASTTETQRAAAPDILILVNKLTQTMTVTVDGHVRYRWRVSTGATQYSTPTGSYTPLFARLTLSHAATLYQLIRSVGMAKTKVVVSGRDPPGYRRATMPPRQPVGPFGGFFRF
jgi:L,D-transpeptidase catalytic domain